MKIVGAVLEETGHRGPYAVSSPLRLRELDLDPPSAHEVLVRMEVAGLCHSDLSVIDGNRPRPLPMLLGHEAAGIVEECGELVAGIDPGDRVVMTFLPRCGECAACATGGRRPCQPGSAANGRGELLAGGRRVHRDGMRIHHHLGVSAFATHAVVDARSVVPVEHDIPPTVAALLGCAVLTGGGAVLNTRTPQPGERVLIVGLGGVGMAALMTAAAQLGVEVIGVDAQTGKFDLATRLGAHACLTPQELLDRRLMAPLVIEAAGSGPALECAIAATEPGGTTVTVGLPAPDARIMLAPTALVGEGRSLVGSYLGSAVPGRDIPTYAQLWRSGRLPVDQLVSRRLSLSQINEGMDELAAGRSVRQVIDF